MTKKETNKNKAAAGFDILGPTDFAARHVVSFIMSRWLSSCLDVSPRSAQISGISDMMPAGSESDHTV
jgi:hypothetical protein